MTEQSANPQESARYGWQTPPQATNALSIGTVDIRAHYKTCPECGAPVASQAASCQECGESLVRVPKQIRCMHCHTTASSELTLCPHCGRELREAPPKLMTVGAPALLALLLVILVATQWSRINPVTWARTNLVRGVVLVEDISARIEPEMVIVMTPIVPETAMVTVGEVPVTEGAADAGQASTVTIDMTGETTATIAGPEVLAASVVQETPFGVGGPKPADQVPTLMAAPEDSVAESDTVIDTTARDAALRESATAEEAAPAAQPAATATPLPPTPTATATSAPVAAVRAAGLAATLATDEPAASTAADSSIQVAAVAADETSAPTPTATPTMATTPLPTPTATPIVYQVRAGDTLVTIAASYGVGVDELMAANDIGEEDVYGIQPGQMLYVPVPTPAAAANAREVADARVEAPVLVVPTSDARVGCNTGGTLIWQRVQFVKDSDRYLLHLGFVSGRDDAGAETVTWVVEQSSPVTVTEWQLDTNLCELAQDEFGRQWRWWVEVVETVDGKTVSVSPPSEMRGFTWQ